MNSIFDTLWPDSALDVSDTYLQLIQQEEPLPASTLFEESLFETFESECSLHDAMETSPNSSPPFMLFDNLIGTEEDFFDGIQAPAIDVQVPQVIEAKVEEEEEEEEEQTEGPAEPVHNLRKRVRLAREPTSSEYDSDYVYEYKRKVPTGKRRNTSPHKSLPKKKTTSPRKKKSPTNKVISPTTEEMNDGNEQCSCCLDGCNNSVTNRLRFSLRGQYSFKLNFLDSGWNKVCAYHYFRDLYQHKKMQSQ